MYFIGVAEVMRDSYLDELKLSWIGRTLLSPLTSARLGIQPQKHRGRTLARMLQCISPITPLVWSRVCGWSKVGCVAGGPTYARNLSGSRAHMITAGGRHLIY